VNEKKRLKSKIRSGNQKTWAMALTIAWCAFVHGLAAAQPTVKETSEAPARHRVLIITDEPADAFMVRVQAEVSALPGFEVVIRRPLGSLDEIARAEHAEAAIRKAASRKGVEVWMADATTGRSLLRQLVVDESPNGPDHGLIALQTAELLRTGLLARHTEPVAPPPPAEAPPDTVVSAPPASPSREDAALVGLGPLWSRGGVGPSWQAWLSYQHLFSSHFGISLDASAPLYFGSISSSQGSARVGALFAGAGLLARLRSTSAHLTATATLAATFASVVSKGEPNANYQGATTTTSTGLAYLRLGATWNPTPWLGWGAAALVGTTTSRLRIQFADRAVGDWGTVLAAALLYGEIAW
jgi:hypothetical protein